MGPLPYSENSSLPNEPTISESLTSVPTQILAETPSPSTLSGNTTPSPVPHEIIHMDHPIDTVDFQDDADIDGLSPCYPTPGDIMPYDHSLPDFIRQITNQPNLANLQSLSLRVISTCISLHRMAAYLPNLRELDLEGSILNSLRDIGCSFKNLQILKVGRCQLESLDGTFGLSGLRELYAQKNLINDVSPCSNLPHIKHIDVSGNRIRNISYAGFLSVCSKLKSIIFTGNPATEVTGYRKHVRRILPQIEALDGVPFTSEENADENKEPEYVEGLGGNESDSSTDIPDFSSVSPSDSMNNLLEPEEEVSLLDKRHKHAKNIANQDQAECADGQDDMHNKYRRAEGVVEQFQITKVVDNRIANLKQKCANVQKLDKDIENRSKQSSLLLNASEERISLPEIATDTRGSSQGSAAAAAAATTTAAAGPKARPVTNAEEEMVSEARKVQRDSKATAGEDGGTTGTQDRTVGDVKSGAIKKKFLTPIPDSTSLSEMPDKDDFAMGVSSLTSGVPIRGNLTAALRSRNRAADGTKSKLDGLLAKKNQMDAYNKDSMSTAANPVEYQFETDNDVDYLREMLVGPEKCLSL